ncbi:MAG: NADH-ubiquinone oxidoreductase-F iron-sulfur binding region domain-containing protein [Actinomycetota bacterium]|nr:NADH-ubiquinone oxidoreductase-F iron-sulfur binding region domain-containing protein [Actinomycetota bacterium]
MLADRLLPPEPLADLDAYRRRGGGEGLSRARRLGSDAVIDEVTRAGVRGRGGGGFPAGRKWRSVRDTAGAEDTTFVVANGAEGEPATFKDRQLMRSNPYQVLEGTAIAQLAVGAARAFVGVKASFGAEIARLEAALVEMEQASWIEPGSIIVVEGPESYLFGEETGLLGVIEGGDALPRGVPPYVHGLFSGAAQLGWTAGTGVGAGAGSGANPTVVNNVETLAAAAAVLANGPGWYRSVGTEQTPGTLLCTVVGDTRRAAVAEVVAGTPLAALVEEVGGGVGDGRSVGAVLSGVANPVITGAHLDVGLSYEAMASLGSGLGAAGFAVYDDRTDMVAIAHAIATFLAVESCGQCPPCKLGCEAVSGLLGDVRSGRLGPEDGALRITGRLRTVTDANRCYLGRQCQTVVASLIGAFPDQFAAERPPARVVDVLVPVIADIVDGVAIYDETKSSAPRG